MILLFESYWDQEIDILELQEHWQDLWQAITFHPLKRLLEFVFDDKSNDTKVYLFVNKRLKLSDKSFTYNTPDLCTIYLKVWDLWTIYIHNMYNLFLWKTVKISQGAIPSLIYAMQVFFIDEHLLVWGFNFHLTI